MKVWKLLPSLHLNSGTDNHAATCLTSLILRRPRLLAATHSLSSREECVAPRDLHRLRIRLPVLSQTLFLDPHWSQKTIMFKHTHTLLGVESALSKITSLTCKIFFNFHESRSWFFTQSGLGVLISFARLTKYCPCKKFWSCLIKSQVYHSLPYYAKKPPIAPTCYYMYKPGTFLFLTNILYLALHITQKLHYKPFFSFPTPLQNINIYLADNKGIKNPDIDTQKNKFCQGREGVDKDM